MKTVSLPTEAVRKILVCQLRQIGDVLLSTASIGLLKQRFPHAEIHVYTEKKCVAMLENNPDVAKVWAVDKKALSTPLKEFSFYWQVSRQGYDIVVDFQQLPRIRWVVALSRAKVRLSYTPEWYNRWIFTHTISPLDGYSAMAKASVLRPLGIEWKGEKPRLYLTERERTWAGGYLEQYGITTDHSLITVDVTHRRATRRWPAKHYAELIRMAAASDASLRFLLLYGPGEEDDVRAVYDACGCPEQVIVPREIISLREMAACIEKASLHLGNCSAPRHVAVAVDTPTFVILGATSGAWTFPSPEHVSVSLGIDCQPCNQNGCNRGLRCLEEFTPDMVWAALQKHLATLS